MSYLIRPHEVDPYSIAPNYGAPLWYPRAVQNTDERVLVPNQHWLQEGATVLSTVMAGGTGLNLRQAETLAGATPHATPVPEPSGLPLLIVGALLVAVARRRRR